MHARHQGQFNTVLKNQTQGLKHARRAPLHGSHTSSPTSGSLRRHHRRGESEPLCKVLSRQRVHSKADGWNGRQPARLVCSHSAWALNIPSPNSWRKMRGLWCIPRQGRLESCLCFSVFLVFAFEPGSPVAQPVIRLNMGPNLALNS